MQRQAGFAWSESVGEGARRDYRRPSACATMDRMMRLPAFHRRAIRSIGLAGMVLTSSLISGSTQPAVPRPAPAPSPWAAWVEPDFPFFSSVLDAGRAGAGLPARNLTPRGLVLNLGRGYWVGVRHRTAARRRGVARARASRRRRSRPARITRRIARRPAGSHPLPEPDGKVWLANGIYPGMADRRAARRSTIRASRRRVRRKSAADRCPSRWDDSRRSVTCAAAWCSSTRLAAPTCASGSAVVRTAQRPVDAGPALSRRSRRAEPLWLVLGDARRRTHRVSGE